MLSSSSSSKLLLLSLLVLLLLPVCHAQWFPDWWHLFPAGFWRYRMPFIDSIQCFGIEIFRIDTNPNSETGFDVCTYAGIGLSLVVAGLVPWALLGSPPSNPFSYPAGIAGNTISANTFSTYKRNDTVIEDDNNNNNQHVPYADYSDVIDQKFNDIEFGHQKEEEVIVTRPDLPKRFKRRTFSSSSSSSDVF